MMEKPRKVALFYYSQTGQALRIGYNICKPLEEAGCEVVLKEIVPEEPYPFPWSSM
jgi:flavodoxin